MRVLLWETELRNLILHPNGIGVKVTPEDIFLLNVRGFYLILGSKFTKEELTTEKFKDLYFKFLDLAQENGFEVEKFESTVSETWIEGQLERIDFKRKFAKAITDMIDQNR